MRRSTSWAAALAALCSVLAQDGLLTSGDNGADAAGAPPWSPGLGQAIKAARSNDMWPGQQDDETQYLDAWVEHDAAVAASSAARSSAMAAAITAQAAADRCRAIQQMQVCSHGANASELADVHALGPHATLAQRMQALEEQAGVACFDLDIASTRKGRLVVGHPNDIKAQLLHLKMQGAGGNAVTQQQHQHLSRVMTGLFPPLKDVLQVFGAITDAHSSHGSRPGVQAKAGSREAGRGNNDAPEVLPAGGNGAAQPNGTQRPGGSVPLLLLELKAGASTNLTQVHEVVHQANQLGISRSVALWVVHTAVLKVMHQARDAVLARQGQVPLLIRAVRNQHWDHAHAPCHPRTGASHWNASAASSTSSGGPIGGPKASGSGGVATRLCRSVRAATVGGAGGSNSGETLLADQLAAYDMVGPSVHFELNSAEAPYAVVRAAHKPMALWTVDSEADLDKAVALAAEYVITNRPLTIKALLQKWGATCSAE